MSALHVALTPFLGFDIEVSAPCNAACSFCPQNWHGVKRRTPYLTPALISKIARDIEETLAEQQRQFRRPSAMVGFCGMGEPLLKKDSIFQFLREFEGSAEFILVTNGFYLTEDVIADGLFGRIDRVIVSMTGWGASYESVYGIDFEQVRQNVLAAHARHPGKISISSVDSPDVPKPDRVELLRFWKQHGVPVGEPTLHSRGGHYSHPAAYPGRTRDFKSCRIFEQMNFISSDAEMLSCCHDVVSDHAVGDVKSESILSIIGRKRGVQRESGGFAICRKCTDFSLA